MVRVGSCGLRRNSFRKIHGIHLLGTVDDHGVLQRRVLPEVTWFDAQHSDQPRAGTIESVSASPWGGITSQSQNYTSAL